MPGPTITQEDVDNFDASNLSPESEVKIRTALTSLIGMTPDEALAAVEAATGRQS
jgi:hypothetical protein